MKVIQFPKRRITKPIWYLKLKNADKTVWLKFLVNISVNGLAALLIWFMIHRISL